MPVKLPVREESSIAEMHTNSGTPEPSIVDQIPLSVVLMLAAPYLAGQTSSNAIKLAHKIYKHDQMSSTLDILGEDSETIEDCLKVVQSYKTLIDSVYASPLIVKNALEQMTISLKPSMFSVTAPTVGGGQDSRLDDAYDRIKQVVDYAFQKNIRLTLEAEDHRWTDFHLETYFSLINEGYTNLGTVIQSRLFRSRNDVRRFDERMRVRLVIGIYQEPAEIAHTDRPIMKEVLVELASELLHRGAYVELASHDTNCVDNFFLNAVLPNKIPASQFETQFLMGVPRKKLQQTLISGKYFENWGKDVEPASRQHLDTLAETGILVRLYLPYGTDKVAGPYCRRRLKNNPNMVGYGIKNLLHIE